MEYEFKYKPSMKIILMNFALDLRIRMAIDKNRFTFIPFQTAVILCKENGPEMCIFNNRGMTFVPTGVIAVHNKLPELLKELQNKERRTVGNYKDKISQAIKSVFKKN